MALSMSRRLGFLQVEQVERIKSLLLRLSLPVVAPNQIASDQFIAHMYKDKKNIDGNIRLVLLNDIGSAFITSDYSAEILLDTLNNHDL